MNTQFEGKYELLYKKVKTETWDKHMQSRAQALKKLTLEMATNYTEKRIYGETLHDSLSDQVEMEKEKQEQS